MVKDNDGKDPTVKASVVITIGLTLKEIPRGGQDVGRRRQRRGLPRRFLLRVHDDGDSKSKLGFMVKVAEGADGASGRRVGEPG